MSRTTTRPTTVGAGLALASALSFGVAGPFATSLLDAGWTPGAVALVRVLGATLILAPFGLTAWAGTRRGDRGLVEGQGRIGAKDWRGIVLYGVTAIAGAQVCFFNAVQHLPVGVALLIEYLAPVLLVFGTAVVTRRAPGRAVGLGAILATLGLVPVLNASSGVVIDPVGVMWALGAAACLCCYFVLSASISDVVPPALLASAGFVVGGVLIAGAGTFGVMEMSFSSAPVTLLGTTTSWIVPALALILVATVFAYCTGIAGVRLLGQRSGSFIALTEVLFAVLFAWLLLGQTPSPVQALGAALILGGVVLVQHGTTAEAAPASENRRTPAPPMTQGASAETIVPGPRRDEVELTPSR